MRYLLFALWAALAVTAGVGCGERRASLSGVVKLDGAALDNGTISLFPEKGEGQTAAATIDKDGHYSIIDASPTKMKVVITSSKVVGTRKKYEGEPDSPVVEMREEVVPAKYSNQKNSELTITLVPGDNKKDWDLTKK
jgi:hypothetical protein